MLVRDEAMRAVGLLDEAFFFYGEETDWCRRFQQAGWGLMFAPVGEITHFGGGSVKKLNHMRDVMLSAGTVRLHRKHFGRVGGLACWMLLAGFNTSRAVLWTLMRHPRGAHFRGVLRNFGQAWPQEAH